MKLSKKTFIILGIGAALTFLCKQAYTDDNAHEPAAVTTTVNNKKTTIETTTIETTTVETTTKKPKVPVKTTVEDVLKPEYFRDEYFKQLNLVVFSDEVYKLGYFNDHKEVVVGDKSYDFSYWNDSVDKSHYTDDYIIPVTDDGTVYMSTYDFTYVYSNDEMTEQFMNLMDYDEEIRNRIMTPAEYDELCRVYDQYRDSRFDVNAYVYHYIAELIADTYGDRLFDYGFYSRLYGVTDCLHDKNEEALAQQFFSIGLFEGRQGCENFNPDNYTICSTDLGEVMMEYAVSGGGSYMKTEQDDVQVRLYDPAYDAYLLEVAKVHSNRNYLEDMRRYDPQVLCEMNSLATYRSRYELHDHDAFAHANINDFADDFTEPFLGVRGFSENKFSCVPDPATCPYYTMLNDLRGDLAQPNSMYYWYRSDPHFKAAKNSDFRIMGQGHAYMHYNPDGITDKKDYDRNTMTEHDYRHYITNYCIYLDARDRYMFEKSCSN